MARLVVKSPYMKPSGKGGRGNYVKYIATRERVEMAEDTSRHLPSTAEQQKEIARLLKQYPDSRDSLEYEDYQNKPTRGNADAFLSAVYELHNDAPRRDVYLKYISERPGVERVGTNGLFTDEGVPIVLAQVQKEMNESQSNIWTHIISLHREDAERLGYNTAESWTNLLRSQRNTIAKEMRISPENFRWYAAFHNEGHHPHVHMMAYSVDPKEAYLTPEGIENIKSGLAKEIFQQDLLQICQRQTQVRDDLRQRTREKIHRIAEDIRSGVSTDPNSHMELQFQLIQVSRKLKDHKGKKVYGYLDRETKKAVDMVVRILSSDPSIQELYELWYRQKEEVLRTYTNTFPKRIPLEENKEFKAIRNAVVQAALTLDLPENIGSEEIYASNGNADDAKEVQNTDIPEPAGVIPQDTSPLSAPLASRVPVSEPLPEVSTWNRETSPVEPPKERVPVYLAALRLCIDLANLLQDSAEQYYYQAQAADHKLRREIQEKKQALGIRTKGSDRTQNQGQSM